MLQRKSDELKLNWVGDVNQDLIKKLFIQIENSEIYQNYLSIDKPTYAQQKDFVVKLMKQEICNSPILLNHFEEMRIHWQDDFDHVFSMLLKTLKSFTEESDELSEIFNLYKEDEEEFAQKLFSKSIRNFDAYTELLGKYTKNWDSERLAKMDIYIMILAITEAKEFPSIPLKVSLNEYIEISKFYSTPKSNTFINGVLDKLFADMQKDGSIRKVGRGLI
jgi:N utilization substance protein B